MYVGCCKCYYILHKGNELSQVSVYWQGEECVFWNQCLKDTGGWVEYKGFPFTHRGLHRRRSLMNVVCGWQRSPWGPALSLFLRGWGIPEQLSLHTWTCNSHHLELPMEKAMAPHSSTLAWKIPCTEEPGGLQSMESLGVGHDWATSLSLFPFMHWRRKWQPTPVFLPGESPGWGSLVGCRLWGCTESDTTEAT